MRQISFQGDMKMRRWSFFAYGVLCYLLFLVTYACMAGFVGNFMVRKSIDSYQPKTCRRSASMCF